MILKDYTLTFSHSTEPERQDPTLKCHLFLSLTITGLNQNKQCTFPEVNCAVCGTEMNDFSLVMTGRPTLFIFKANWTHDSPIAAPENELNRRRLFAISVTIKWAKRSNRFAMKERP